MPTAPLYLAEIRETAQLHFITRNGNYIPRSLLRFGLDLRFAKQWTDKAGVGGVEVGMDGEGQGNDNDMQCNFVSFSCTYTQVIERPTTKPKSYTIDIARSLDSVCLWHLLVLLLLRRLQSCGYANRMQFKYRMESHLKIIYNDGKGKKYWQ